MQCSNRMLSFQIQCLHDDVFKWKYFPRYWPFVRGIRRSLVNSPHKGQWHGALTFSLICAWTNGWLSRRWWFKTPSRWLWRHRNVYTDWIMFSVSRYIVFIYTETEMSGWLPCLSLETLKAIFSVPSDDKGSHPDELSVSVIIIAVLH